MAKEALIVPASELDDYEFPNISWRVPLPDYAPAENIMVNVSRLSRLALMGGMQHLHINAYSGDRSSVSPELGDANKDGAATAVLKATVSKTDVVKADSSLQSSDDLFSLFDYRWSDSKVSLNLDEIDERVARKSNLRDPKEWSKQIDKALRKGVRESSWQSLISNSDEKYLPAVILGSVVFWNEVFCGFNDKTIIYDATTNYLAMATVGVHVFSRLIGFKGRFSERKHTLLPGLSIDRYTTVNVATRLKPLVTNKSV